MLTFVHTIFKQCYLKVKTIIIQMLLCLLEIIYFIEMPHLFYFKGIKNVSNKKAFCLALLLSFFSLPDNPDYKLLLHKLILAEIFTFVFFPHTGNLVRGL